MGVCCQRHALTALSPGKRIFTLCAGGWVGPHGRCGRLRKILPQPEYDPRTVQSLAGFYTD